MLDDTKRLAEQVAPKLTVESLLRPRFREGLTWEACAENVMRRNVFGCDSADIPNWLNPEVAKIERAEIRIDLACKDACMPKPG
jgi:hypothetical protein